MSETEHQGVVAMTETPPPVSRSMGAEPPLDWSNFEGPKRNLEWKPDDRDLIYTAINFRDDEWGDADEDAGQQIVERLLAAWKSAAISEQITFENAVRLLKERDELRAGIKRLSDEEELCDETAGDDPFSMVRLAAKLAVAEDDLSGAKHTAKNALSDMRYWRNQYEELSTDRLADKIEDLIAEFGDDPKAALECVSEHLQLRRHAGRAALAAQASEGGL